MVGSKMGRQSLLISNYNGTASSTHFETSMHPDILGGNYIYPKSTHDAPVHIATATRVPLATMINTLSPSLTHAHVDDVIRVLRHNGNINDEGWTAFEALCSPKGKRDKKNTGEYERRHSSERYSWSNVTERERVFSWI